MARLRELTEVRAAVGIHRTSGAIVRRMSTGRWFTAAAACLLLVGCTSESGTSTSSDSTIAASSTTGSSTSTAAAASGSTVLDVATTSSAVPTAMAMVRYENLRYGFSIGIPAGWSQQEPDAGDGVIASDPTPGSTITITASGIDDVDDVADELEPDTVSLWLPLFVPGASETTTGAFIPAQRVTTKVAGRTCDAIDTSARDLGGLTRRLHVEVCADAGQPVSSTPLADAVFAGYRVFERASSNPAASTGDPTPLDEWPHDCDEADFAETVIDGDTHGVIGCGDGWAVVQIYQVADCTSSCPDPATWGIIDPTDEGYYTTYPFTYCLDRVHRDGAPAWLDLIGWPRCAGDEAPISYRDEPATGPLSLGDHGPRVVEMQQTLQMNEWPVSETDGYFGWQTLRALHYFQGFIGNPADGVQRADE